MSAPNDFRFTSSNKEKVALLINRKQGENYHMRPLSQDKLLIQMHLDVPCTARASS